MKTVGKQLQEARLARNWTPEMASRETKIKVERVKDLEADDYSPFNNATYARGFVRTYARALGLDEYKILRQLDNKLPDDDSANIVGTEGGLPYLPETAMPPRVAHRDFTGLYVVLGLGAAVMLVIAFVLFRAYQVGELGKWTGEDTASSATNNASSVAVDDQAPKKALPIDSNTPPPTPAAEPAQTNAPAAVALADDTAHALRAQSVDLNAASAPPKALPVDATAPPAATPTPAPAAPATADIPVNAPKALPVDPATLNAANAPSPSPTPAPVPAAVDTVHARRALPVDPSTLVAANTATASAPTPADVPVNAPRALPVDPATLNVPPANGPVVLPPPNAPGANGPAEADAAKPLVLTASHDSFVRVTMLDPDSVGKQVYADVLHSGQSVSFAGHKFSVSVDNPSAVNVQLDGVNYGPPGDGTDPKTFTVISHVQ
jgi:cytoskeleton protein RodZ